MPSDARPDWRTVPLVIGVGCVASMLIFGVRATFTALFNVEVTAEFFGGDASVFALALGLQNFLWGLGAPFAGAVAERYGNGRVIATGTLMFGGGIILSAFTDAPIWFTFTAGVIVGVGLACTSFAIIFAAMARRVPEERRTWALGIGTAAGSLGQLLIVPLGGILKAGLDWQMAMVILGGMVMLLLVAAVVFAGKPQGAGPGQIDQKISAAVREASRHGSYWLLTFGFFVCGFHVTFILVHIQPYVADLTAPGSNVPFTWYLLESPATLVTLSVMFIGGFNMVGSYIAGILGSKYQKKTLLSLLYLARAVAIIVLLLFPKSDLLILAFAAIMGLGWLSTVPLTQGMVGYFFGPRYMATLFGFVFFSHQLGALIGSYLGGYLREFQGDYVTMWWINVALGVFAALIHLPIREQPVARLQRDMAAS